MGISGGIPAAEAREDARAAREQSRNLALALLSLAESAGMPDTYWQTDSRVRLAREVLNVPDHGRYDPKFEDMMDKYDEERLS